MSSTPIPTTASAVEHTTPDNEELLARVAQQLGRVPNLYAALASGPAALEGYLAMRDHLTRGVLRPRLREQLALLIAQENECTYCVSAHSFRGGLIGLTEEQLRATRDGHDADPHADAVLGLARTIMRTRGRVTDADRAAAHAAGVTDAEQAEIVAHIALNTLSNYYNHLARPELDFPEARA
ncbi:carboxymuconolactone decarboxylase family protein [Embleya scabrispora]|uniref:carboxymuconolactone decarboxylase family protein n=1 Tax=Embleya scabrispora TaxID=159449 RepID=UPI00035C6281|nr:carboxymuconolactone decarboxylase family protein [Embleya scabrispora]MYS87307.1 carboxymuconolactone decarboxylase family protein [Streptomyces sp. SID5474]